MLYSSPAELLSPHVKYDNFLGSLSFMMIVITLVNEDFLEAKKSEKLLCEIINIL